MFTYTIFRTLFLGLVFFGGVSSTSRVNRLSTVRGSERAKYKRLYEQLGMGLTILFVTELLVIFITQASISQLFIAAVFGMGWIGPITTLVASSAWIPALKTLYREKRSLTQIADSSSTTTSHYNIVASRALETLQLGRPLAALRMLEKDPRFICEALAISIDNGHWTQALTLCENKTIGDGYRKQALQQIYINNEVGSALFKRAASMLLALPGGYQRLEALNRLVAKQNDE